MLQYPVQLPPLSLSNNPLRKDLPRPNDSNRRFQKETIVPRSPYQTTPLSVTTNLSTSRSKQQQQQQQPPPSSPIFFTNPQSWPSSKSSIASSTVHDVLFPGDFVRQGGTLQGDTIRLVSIGNTPTPMGDYHEPAAEFVVRKRLGHGSYAVVYLVQEVLERPQLSDDGHMPTMGMMDLDSNSHPHPRTVYGREYAIKCLSKANLDEEDLAAQMSEVTIHQSLRSHPNIATLHRTLETSSFLLLLLEYVPGQDLFYFLEQACDNESDTPTTAESSVSRTPPTPSLLSNMHPSQLLSPIRLRLISSMFAQMCEAVEACHDQQVFHRDIKPENFIVTDGWSTLPNGRQERKVIVKLTDFGLSTTDLASSDMDCGSAPYMSYECRNNVAPTYRPRAADVWSLGIVLINMLYHYNPWTDTAHGVCSSFDLYRRDPVNFFMCRFTGMTRPVAEHLANRVFCILDDPEDDSRRITAGEFGTWVRSLPTLLGGHGVHRTISNSSTQGHPISASLISHRPCSRHPSGNTSAGRTPAMPTRSLSRAPSLGPAYEQRELSDLSTVLDQEHEDLEMDDQYNHDLDLDASRSTSTNKRRKRGARKGKGSIITTSNDEMLASLADASQSLAREISRASKKSSSTNMSISTKASSSSTRRPHVPFEPVSMFAMPSALLAAPRSGVASSSVRSPPASVRSTPSSTVRSTSTSVPAVSTPSAPSKKPSKWKLSFGKNSAVASVPGRVSPVEEVPPPTSPDVVGSPPSTSTTASNVTDLIRGLDAPPSSAPTPDDSQPTGSRGRRGTPYNMSNVSSKSLELRSSPSPESRERTTFADRRYNRGISPNSIRSTRPVASSASSMVSRNWRSSVSTTSSAGTSTSAFTRYSNSSTRSVSTAATSVSSTSWRTSVRSGQSRTSSNSGYAALPKNIKLMNGVPWELDQLPRAQHPNPIGDIFGAPPVRKQRTRKPKDLKLDTINERPGQVAARKPDTQRRDASTSTTDLGVPFAGKDEGECSNKKVQKGQINALAKMLSALRR